MKEFDVIRLLFIAIPTGMFATYGLFLVIILMLKVKKTDDVFRKLMSFYCFFAGLSGLMLPVFYFLPEIFARLSILYFALVAYTMIVFHHFLYHAARLEKRFNLWQYPFPALTCAGLLAIRDLFPEMWISRGTEISLTAALVFGIIYTVLPLYETYKFSVKLAIKSGTTAAVDKSSVIPFIGEILLYPTVSIVLPLAGGANPGIFTSLLLMLGCSITLIMNIPLTYSLVQHYIVSPLSNMSLFESTMATATVSRSIEQKQEEQPERIVETSKRAYRKYSKKQLKGGQLIELDKRVFDSYFRKNKPYLNPQLTILDLVEPLKSNRTYISKFVNSVYGMSFSSYVNLCRLKEMERLRQLLSNEGKSEAALSLKAGFGKYRNYLYVKKQLSAEISKFKQ